MNTILSSINKINPFKLLSITCCVAGGAIAGFAISGLLGLGFGIILGFVGGIILDVVIKHLALR